MPVGMAGRVSGPVATLASTTVSVSAQTPASPGSRKPACVPSGLNTNGPGAELEVTWRAAGANGTARPSASTR
jgi:hypothetical protein